MRIALTLAALVVLVAAISRQIRRQLTQPRHPAGWPDRQLSSGVSLFALIDYTVAYYAPTEFAGLRTRLDALYFALATLLTVGYGDISARGQIARGLLCVQMLLNVMVLTTAASLVAQHIVARSRSRRS